MGGVTGTRQFSEFLVIVAAAAGLWAAVVSAAEARPYTVYACDAAGFWSFASNAWTPLGVGTIERRCPSGGSAERGLTTRLVGANYGGFTASIFDFHAPPGTSITAVRWSGRLGRTHCSWHARLVAFPFEATLVGLNANQNCADEGLDVGPAILTFPTPPGTTHLRQMVACGAPRCPPGASFYSRYVEVDLEDGWNPNLSASGALAEGRWVRSRQVVSVTADDNTGIRRVQADLPGTPSVSQEFACNPTFAAPCPAPRSFDLSLETGPVSDGTHTLTVQAVDAAGNTGLARRTVRVDNTPPDPVAPSLAGGEAWRATNDFDLRWVNSGLQHAPITAAHWELCSEGRCVDGTQRATDIDSLENLAVQRPGNYAARVWLEDEAGNARKESAIATVHLRFDPEPPTLTFEPPDPADPLRVGVTVTDRPSGVHGGEIEMRRVGTNAWHGLETRLENGRLFAYVDDQRFQEGLYEFRAHAVDNAGNEASIGPRDPGAASLRLPVRAVTRLRAGVRRISLRRVVVRQDGRQRRVKRRVVRLDADARVRSGRWVRLDGRLTNHEGQPLADATVDVLDETGRRLLATLQTARDGRFGYRFRAHRNRVVRFHYRGSRRVAPADAAVRISVPAASSIRVSRSVVLNGESVLFRGRVVTRPIPAAGKLIEVQAHFRNRWRTFSTVRTDRAGRWQFPYQFGGTVGSVRYRFRTLMPAEGGYPFIAGTSKVIRVLVIGL